MGQLADGLLIPYREQIKQLQEEVTRLKTQNELQNSVINNLKETNLALLKKINDLNFTSEDSELYQVIQDSVLNAVKHIKLKDVQEEKIQTIVMETFYNKLGQSLRQLIFRILVDNFPNMNFRDSSSGIYYNMSNIPY